MSNMNMGKIISTASKYNNDKQFDETIELVEPHIRDKSGKIIDNPFLLSTLGNAFLGKDRANDAIRTCLKSF